MGVTMTLTWYSHSWATFCAYIGVRICAVPTQLLSVRGQKNSGEAFLATAKASHAIIGEVRVVFITLSHLTDTIAFRNEVFVAAHSTLIPRCACDFFIFFFAFLSPSIDENSI
jgi:hypothetical protein